MLRVINQFNPASIYNFMDGIQANIEIIIRSSNVENKTQKDFFELALFLCSCLLAPTP